MNVPTPPLLLHHSRWYTSISSVNVILTPIFPQISVTSQEITHGREQALDSDSESAKDDEILEVSAFLVRIQGMKPGAYHFPAIYSNSYLISMSRYLICSTASLIDSYTCIARTTTKNCTPRRATIHQAWTGHRY